MSSSLLPIEPRAPSESVYDSPLLDAMPPSIADYAETQAFCYAVDRQMREVILAIPECIIIPVIEEITNPALVDLLAWSMHVDFYDQTWPLAQRKAAVKNSIQWHIRKGTVDLVQEVIDTYYPGGAFLDEWFNYKDPFPPNYPVHDPGGLGSWHDRYRFRILVDQSIIPPEREAALVDLINRYKPASRWLESIIYLKPSQLESIFWAGITKVGHNYYFDAPTELPPEPLAEIAAGEVELDPPIFGVADLQAGLVMAQTEIEKIGQTPLELIESEIEVLERTIENFKTRIAGLEGP